VSIGARYTEEDLREEDLRIQQLRDLVDQTAIRLRQGSLSYEENRRLIDKTREKVVELFPDKGDLFDLIHRARFYRILEETYFIDGGR
jgi:predicted secreted protein